MLDLHKTVRRLIGQGVTPDDICARTGLTVAGLALIADELGLQSPRDESQEAPVDEGHAEPEAAPERPQEADGAASIAPKPVEPAKPPRSRHGPNSSWNDAREAKLKELWREGLSASQCAARLGGVTRNGIIGKVWRLRLTRGEADNQRNRRRGKSMAAPNGFNRHPERRSSQPKPSRPIAPPIPDEAPEPIPVFEPEPFPVQEDSAVTRPSATEPIGIMDLREKTCRWPFGDRPPFRYCGAPTCGRGSGVYCSHHAAIAFVGIPGKSKREFSFPTAESGAKAFTPARAAKG